MRTGATGEHPKPGYILFLKLPALPDMLLAPRLPEVEPREPAETKRGPGWMDQDVLLSALRGDVPAYRGFAKWCGGCVRKEDEEETFMGEPAKGGWWW